MHAVLSVEQELLASTVRSLGSSIGIENPRDLETADRATAWKCLADTGLLGLRAREDGIPVGSGVDAMVVAQEHGAALSIVAFIPSAVLAVELLELAGESDLAAAVTEGTIRPALMLDRQMLGLADVSAAAGAVVWGGEAPEWALALRRGDGAHTLVRVEIDDQFVVADATDLTATLLRSPSDSAWKTTDLGSALDDAALDRWLALALTVVSADCAGAMRASLLGLIEYTKQRYAYDAPIGSYQALQHICADAFVSCEGAVTTNSYAAWAVDELDAPQALLAARTAKAWVAAVARDVVEAVMQIYGGIGQTWEHVAHVYTRRALMDVALFGTENHQLLAIHALRERGV